MAETGLRYPVAAKRNPADGTHSAGIVVAKMMKVDLSPTLAEAILYGDDGEAEAIKEFGGATLSVGVTYISDDAQKLLYGHTTAQETLTVDSQQVPVDVIKSKSGDAGETVGFGFYAPCMRDHVKKFRAFWFPCVVFGEPGLSLTTKGNTITFNTPTTTGTVMVDDQDDSNWKDEITVADAKTAIAWLKERADIAP